MLAQTTLRIDADKTAGPAIAPARFRWSAALLMAALTLVGAFLTRAPTLTDWDSWEYAAQAINQSCSNLCLGRWWFDFLMHQAYVVGSLFGLDLLNGFQAMRVAVALMTAGAVVALMYWTFQLTRKMATALVAGGIAMLSGPLLAFSSAVMTEGPTLLMLILAYVFWEKSLQRSAAGGGWRAGAWALVAGLSLGIMVDMREPALFLCAWPVVSCFVDRPNRRWRLLALAIVGTFITLGFGVFMADSIWRMSQGRGFPEVFASYTHYMNDERTYYGWDTTGNVGYLLMHLYRAVPMMSAGAVIFVIWLVCGGRHCAQARAIPGWRLAAIGLSAIPYCLMTWYNPDLPFNNRLVLPLAWVLVPAAAAMIQAVGANPWRSMGVPCSMGILPMSESAEQQQQDAGGTTATHEGKMPSTQQDMGTLATPRFVKKLFFASLGAVAICITAFSISVEVQLYMDWCDFQARVYNSVLAVPRDSTGRHVGVASGPGAPMVIYLRDIGVRPDMEGMIPGCNATTENMTDRFTEQFKQGRRVFVNPSKRFQTRPDGKCFEWAATYEAARKFRQMPGPGILIEILPNDASSASAAASIYVGPATRLAAPK